jgi:hypothetical protein
MTVENQKHDKRRDKAPKEVTPLRGEAAWKAARAEVAKKNAAAWEQGRKHRAARNAKATARRVEEERHERANLPPTQFG